MAKEKTKDIISTFGITSLEEQSKSWFFGIGINEYQYFDKLNNAVKDIEDVLVVLSERYVIDEKIVLLNQNATQENITNHLEDLADKVGPEDKLIIYYSGHGYLRKKTGYWVPVDGKPGKRGTYVRNETILGCVEDIDAKHILLISDSCFSGSLVKRDASNSARALEELEKDKSRWILSSGRQNEKVGDGEAGKNSPFATCILKVLRDNQHPKLNVAAMSDQVIKLISFNYVQMPQGSPLFGVGHEGGQYIFHLKTLETEGEARQEEEASTWEVPILGNTTENRQNEVGREHAIYWKKMISWTLLLLVLVVAIFEVFYFIKQKSGGEGPMLSSKQDTIFLEIPPSPMADTTSGTAKEPNLYGSVDLGNRTYKTIELNGLTWLAENLDFDPGDGSWCFEEKPINCEKYGRLYTWKAAQLACKKLGQNWRVPSDREWRAMAKLYGGVDEDASDGGKAAYEALINMGNSGFNAYPGGIMEPKNPDKYSINTLGETGGYWSSTLEEKKATYVLFSGTNDALLHNRHNISGRFSCRCVRD